ncbi:MAG: sensor histidine kinase, partial [Vicinamibacterales bacterium]
RNAVALYEDVADEKGVTIQVTAPAELTLVADRNRMRQAFANLVDNAVKYTGPAGQVSIDAREDERRVVVVVRDNGIGIAPGDLPRIWDRLYRSDESRSERGLGLGLSLVKAIVEAHSGSVAVRSTVGEGSTFTVSLPLRPSRRAVSST